MSRWHTTEFDYLPELAFKPRGWKGAMTLEGGGKGGPSAPPPDPRLVEAQLKSMGIQDSAIQRVMSIAEDMAPLQKAQMQFGLDTSRTAYQQSQQDREYALGRRANLTTLQDQQLADAQGFNGGARANELAAQATADVESGMANARLQASRGLERRGINPASGTALALNNQMSVQQAAMRAQAATMARTAARQEGYQLTDRAANSLAGYPAMGMSTTGAGAGFGASGLSLANSGLAGLNAGYGAAGGMAGNFGANATGMFNAQANYQTGMERAQGDGGAGLLVGLANAGAVAYASDRRLKKNIKLVGKTDSGLNIYSFQYKSGGGTVLGVMADEVEQVRPAAVHKRAIDGEYDAVDYSML